MLRSGTFSFKGVGTQMTNVSRSPMATGSSVKDSRPLAIAFSSRRSSTSSTGLCPWRSPATRLRSGSYPITRCPASAAAHANGSPT
jgi:hypothetical protein